ncbi:MAG TPA: DNA repair ATPase, partial [Acidobacteriota bacterium]|nr:DNA repair ATPase [Acidobacteriota bacterium]
MTTPHIPQPTSGQEIDRGTYEVIRDRLLAQARILAEKTNALNQRRLDLFGSSELAIIGSERIRTVHNCIPRDIINAGRYM